MSFTESLRSCFSKYTTFSGRASRSEYWYFTLFCFLAGGISGALNPILGSIVCAGLILPGISVVVRRLHDLDKSGWYYWFALIPIVGVILLLVWFCTRGTDGDNRFGSDPLTGSAHSSLSPTAGPRSSLSIADKAEQLTKLKAMYDAGTLSQAEFDRMKAELLA